MEGYLGMIMLWAVPWVPEFWVPCDGRLLRVADYTALFSLLGTNYGGDGITTFGVPDFRGRIGLGAGSGPGLSSRILGQRFGTETNVLTVDQLPSFSAQVQGTTTVQIPGQPASTNNGTSATPVDGSSIVAQLPTLEIGEEEIAITGYTTDVSDCALRSPGSVSGSVAGQTMPVGSNHYINNMPPVETVNYIICVNGTYPQRP